MKNKILNKKIKGLSLLEALIVIGISIIVGLSIFAIIQMVQEKVENQNTAALLTKVTDAMDKRFSVDGYSAANFKKTEWTTQLETNTFLNEFNGKNTGCVSTGWVPNTKDTVLKNKYLKTKMIPCNIFKDKGLLDSKMDARIVVNGTNNQILVSYISFYYNTKEEVQKNFSHWGEIFKEAYNRDSVNNVSKHFYGFVDRNKKEFIPASQCVVLGKDCGFAVGVASNEATSIIHLSTVGENSQVGKLAFTQGMLNPQVCQKWTKSESSGDWSMQTTVCGIENVNDKIGFKLNEVRTDSVYMDKLCDITGVIPNSKFVDVTINGGNVIPTNPKQVPCGVNSVMEKGDFVVTALVDDLKTTSIFSKDLSSYKFNANSIVVNLLNVDDQAEVQNTTTVTGLGIKDSFTGNTINSTSTKSSNFKANNQSNITDYTSTGNMMMDETLAIIEASNINNLYTNDITADLITTPNFTSTGAFNIGGNIITSNFLETGILSANNVSITTSTTPSLVNSSGSLGGYAEVNGTTNKDKIGVSANSVYVGGSALVTGNFSSYTRDNQIKMYNSANQLTFGVTSYGSTFLRDSISIGTGNPSYYNISSNGDVTANTPTVYFNGSGIGAPVQFYKDLRVSGTYDVNDAPRFIDVEDTSWNSSSFVVDPNFMVYGGANPVAYANTLKMNSLVKNQQRLSNYAYFIGNYEGKYNSIVNAINTPGLGGPDGITGPDGLPGLQGDKGVQGDQGDQGNSGPNYDERRVIWLPKEVTCGTNDSDMNTKYKSAPKISAWTYNDVIEGICETSGKGSIKYFRREKPIDNTCSGAQKEYDVYECKEAKYRKEPFKFNNVTQGYFCLGDSVDKTDPTEGIIDEDKNTVCYTDTNSNHQKADRADRNITGFVTVGTFKNNLGIRRSAQTSVKSIIGDNNWQRVSTCDIPGKAAADLKGLEQAEFIEDTFPVLPDSDVNAACKIADAMSYRKVNSSTSTLFGDADQFEDYKDNKYKNIEKFVSKNPTACTRETLYEINKCTNTYPTPGNPDYTTHPKGFPMPKAEDAPIDTGLTGRYLWLKDSTVCLSGDIKDTYKNVTDWYSTDRINDACSVENAYRAESIGACAGGTQTSFQLYRCRDEYYKPAVTPLAITTIDIRCIRSNPTDGSTPESIESFYPSLPLVSSPLVNGSSCTVERQRSGYKEANSSSCSASGSDRYLVYECR